MIAKTMHNDERSLSLTHVENLLKKFSNGDITLDEMWDIIYFRLDALAPSPSLHLAFVKPWAIHAN